MDILCPILSFLLLTILVAATSRRGNCGYHMCECDPNHGVATCKDHGSNLTYIPKLPEYITKIKFSRNFLPNVSSRTFQNISSLNLLEMTITYSSVEHITPDAFDELIHLKSLSLNGNKIPANILAGVFPSVGNLSLSTLSLERVHLRNTRMFRQLQSTSLRALILDRNEIIAYNQRDFDFVVNLKNLSLAHNSISIVNLAFSQSLQGLNLRDNFISFFPKFCKISGSFFPNLTELKLDHNSFKSIFGESIQCLKSLEVLSLNTNGIISLTQNTFSEMPSLTDLILRNLKIEKIERYAFNNSNVKYISLTHSGTHFRNGVDHDAFRGCSNIKSLDMSYNVFNKATEDDFNAWFGHLTTLTGIGLGGCNLKQYPLFIPQRMQSIKYLKLYRNVIEEIPAEAFDPLINLTHLWLNGNAIANVNEMAFSTAVQKRLQVISLMDNPFACNCELLWFLDWTKSEPQKFQLYPKKYRCDSPNNMKGRIFPKVDLTPYTCLLPLSVSLIVMGCTGMFLLILITVSLTYRWRWHIRYYMYLRKKKRGHFMQFAPRVFVYDAYVVYSLQDIKWIKNELIQNLETVSGKKLYIRDRDSLAGIPIVDNVVNNMAVSRSVLVVLSNAMSKDELCQFELMFVQRQKEEERSPIILVLLEEIQAVNMTQAVYALVKMHSYITWTEEQQAWELFWNHLQQSLHIGGEVRAQQPAVNL